MGVSGWNGDELMGERREVGADIIAMCSVLRSGVCFMYSEIYRIKVIFLRSKDEHRASANSHNLYLSFPS